MNLDHYVLVFEMVYSMHDDFISPNLNNIKFRFRNG